MVTSLIFTAALPSVLPCISIGRMNRYRNTTARYKRQMRMAGLVSRNSSRNNRISAVMMAVVNRMMRLSKKMPVLCAVGIRFYRGHMLFHPYGFVKQENEQIPV